MRSLSTMVAPHILLLLVASCLAQRPFYAGRRPIGYPEQAAQYELDNRFGGGVLPVDARGDRTLVARIQRLPVDQQPFWYLNSRQIEELRRNPKSWPLEQNSFSGN